MQMVTIASNMQNNGNITFSVWPKLSHIALAKLPKNWMIMPLSTIHGHGLLFHIQHQAFEVFAFGVVDVDGVVGGLGELMEYAHAAA